ncbi:hypothetical protein L6164_003104 [Bauhinia variegata]|uniref:Uncharacterized protein n=1 Tax=Bauhinia variegata TaxID=167791 RepID=A0ACB9Q5S1_BAUVA|nr:hypothetical protein L6164_003104 [Bauhinia variegata]
MEPHRRLAILCSHLRPIGSGSSPCLLSSGCASVSVSEKGLGDTQKENLQDDCVFCKIIRGKSPAFKLYEDDMCLCILDTNPLSPGHSLIIPKSHFPSLDATPPSVIAAMCSKVPFISTAIMKATGSDSFNLLVNNGRSAGQVIFHTHVHIIPRKAYDCLWTSESLPRHPLKLNEEASQLAARVQEQMLLLSDICQDSKNEDFCPSKN